MPNNFRVQVDIVQNRVSSFISASNLSVFLSVSLSHTPLSPGHLAGVSACLLFIAYTSYTPASGYKYYSLELLWSEAQSGNSFLEI
jgi:hypothetical protein